MGFSIEFTVGSAVGWAAECKVEVAVRSSDRVSDRLLALMSGHLAVMHSEHHSEIETVPLLVLPMVLRMDSSTNIVSMSLWDYPLAPRWYRVLDELLDVNWNRVPPLNPDLVHLSSAPLSDTVLTQSLDPLPIPEKRDAVVERLFGLKCPTHLLTNQPTSSPTSPPTKQMQEAESRDVTLT